MVQNRDHQALTPSFLLTLPPELLLYVINQLPVQAVTHSMINLLPTCRSFYSLFKEELIRQKENSKKLLAHVLKGEEAEAKKMLTINPRLIFIKTQAEDYAKDL